MATRRSGGIGSRGFTLIELIAVIIVLAILAGVAVPRYIDYTNRARTAALQGTLANVRSAVHNFYANAALNGTAAYPTLAELDDVGVVMADTFPPNPYNGLNSVATATAGEAGASPRDADNTAGWRYYVVTTGTSATFTFWSDMNTATTAAKPGGGTYLANEL